MKRFKNILLAAGGTAPINRKWSRGSWRSFLIFDFKT